MYDLIYVQEFNLSVSSVAQSSSWLREVSVAGEKVKYIRRSHGSRCRPSAVLQVPSFKKFLPSSAPQERSTWLNWSDPKHKWSFRHQSELEQKLPPNLNYVICSRFRPLPKLEHLLESISANRNWAGKPGRALVVVGAEVGEHAGTLTSHWEIQGKQLPGTGHGLRTYFGWLPLFLELCVRFLSSRNLIW